MSNTGDWIELNKLYEWTEEDRAKGECPVPAGSDVTVWSDVLDEDNIPHRVNNPEDFNWGAPHITAYLVHSFPKEPLAVWVLVTSSGDLRFARYKFELTKWQKEYGGEIKKMIEAELKGQTGEPNQ